MSSFLMKKKIGEIWVNMPANLTGGDASGTYPSIMDRFYGMVFNVMRAGTYNLPSLKFYMPDMGDIDFNTSFTSTVNIMSPIRLCVGFMRLGNESYFSDGDYQLQTSVDIDEQIIGTFNFTFTIENNIVKNFTWKNAEGDTNSLTMRSLNFTNGAKCFPVIFAIQDTDEFNNNYIEETAFHEIMVTYGLPAKWVKPVNDVEITDVFISFTVKNEGVGEFNMPKGYIKDIGSTITLPTYDSLFYKNFIPLKWLIDNVAYPLGGTYTVPAHNVTAELIYDSKCYSGLIF